MSSRWFQPRAKICVAANRLRSGSLKRSKESIATVRHPYLHFDTAQEVRPTPFRAADTVPAHPGFLSTSLGKYQILCRVDSLTFEQESSLKLLVIPFGGDLARTDCYRVLRTPGFPNCKYDLPYSVTVTYPCDPTSNPGDFRLDIPAANAMLLPHAIPSRKHSDKHTNSEHDWAWILHELAHGEYAARLTRALAFRRSDSPVVFVTASGRLDCPIGQTLPHRRRSDEDVVTLRVIHRRFGNASTLRIRKDPGKGAVEAPAKEAYIWGGVRCFCAGAEGMIRQLILFWCRSGASHRKNLDTPPLRGCCGASRGVPERLVRNE